MWVEQKGSRKNLLTVFESERRPRNLSWEGGTEVGTDANSPPTPLLTRVSHEARLTVCEPQTPVEFQLVDTQQRVVFFLQRTEKVKTRCELNGSSVDLLWLSSEYCCRLFSCVLVWRSCVVSGTSITRVVLFALPSVWLCRSNNWLGQSCAVIFISLLVCCLTWWNFSSVKKLGLCCFSLYCWLIESLIVSSTKN